MPDSSEKINQLQTRLDKMVEYQDYFYREINQIRDELKSLRTASPPVEASKPPLAASPVVEAGVPSNEPLRQPFPRKPVERPQTTTPPIQEPAATAQSSPMAARQSSGLEEIVGKNLFSLLGIIITIIGVGIGAKYAIDRDLISPTTRIVLGYAFAAAMFGIAVWLKSKYLNFSAVLISGALAMMYFLTFFAYSFYGLFPQTAAFTLMLVITAVTVAAAINYNRQVIAHIGLVGAYAVPFLLSEDSGRADILFGYMAIINFGILIISVVKFWKPLFYTSFAFTWLIYAAWYLSSYRADEHFALAFGFALIFFLTFYLTFLSYKLLAKELFNAEIVVLVLINSFIFYAFGYAILDSRAGFEPYLGLYTLFNALINFVFAVVIHRYNLGDRKNFYLAMALAVAFVTIAVPIQFTGGWVTLLWTAEAALLFWVGRVKQIALYENLSYPLIVIASISMANDWVGALAGQTAYAPLFNRNFLTTILFAAAFGFITFINRDGRYRTSLKEAVFIVDFAVPTIFLFALYNAFRTEIGNYFYQTPLSDAIVGDDAANATSAGSRINYFNVIWQINYSMLFLTLLSFVNIKKVKSATLGIVNLVLNCLVLAAFLSLSLYLFSELRADFLVPVDGQNLPSGFSRIFIRYVSLGFVAALIYAGYEYVKQEFLHRVIAESSLALLFDFVLYVSILWIASSELINWMDISGYKDSHKLGLTIFWGIYALLLIGLGIYKQKAHLRIGAIVLFAVTLVKLFFYDIADLDTISKTVVFVILGVLLLTISFLYNKYKDLIFGKSPD